MKNFRRRRFCADARYCLRLNSPNQEGVATLTIRPCADVRASRRAAPSRLHSSFIGNGGKLLRNGGLIEHHTRLPEAAALVGGTRWISQIC